MASIFNSFGYDPFTSIEDVLNSVEPISVTIGANDTTRIAENYFNGSINTAEPTIEYDASFSLFERLGTIQNT